MYVLNIPSIELDRLMGGNFGIVFVKMCKCSGLLYPSLTEKILKNMGPNLETPQQTRFINLFAYINFIVCPYVKSLHKKAYACNKFQTSKVKFTEPEFIKYFSNN